MIHALQSFSWYVGNRRLKRSWLAMYAMLPFTGAAMAVVFYLVLRAGFISAQASTPDISPFGFAAVAGLVGLFSEQATEKLKQVLENILAPAPKGEDQAPANPVVINSVAPSEGHIDDTVTITGSGLSAVTAVDFNGGSALPIMVSDGRIDIKVPAGASSGPISVITQSGSVVAAGQFTVLAIKAVVSTQRETSPTPT